MYNLLHKHERRQRERKGMKKGNICHTENTLNGIKRHKKMVKKIMRNREG